MPATGGKIELTDRIACFLDTGNVLSGAKKSKVRHHAGIINENTTIEPDFVCTQKHRAFFEQKIGKNFSFYVAFQKWLKSNTGKTYGEAITAYYRILEEKKKGKSLEEAIKCWKYKKSLQGHNRYEKSDLIVLS